MAASFCQSYERHQFRKNVFDHEIVDLSQFFNDLLPFRNSVFETNRQDWIDLHVHFTARINGSKTDLGYYCLAIHDWRIYMYYTGEDLKIPAPIRVYGHSGSLCNSDMHKAVFIPVDQFIESPKDVRPKIRSQFKRLQPLYDCLSLRAEFRDHLRKGVVSPFPLPDSFCPGFTFIPDDRELTIASILLAERSGMCAAEGIDQMIQSPSEILHNISDEHRKRLIGDWIASSLYPEIARSIGARLKPTGELVVCCEPTLACDIQLFQMHICTLKLEDAARFWGLHTDSGHRFLVSENEPAQPMQEAS